MKEIHLDGGPVFLLDLKELEIVNDFDHLFRCRIKHIPTGILATGFSAGPICAREEAFKDLAEKIKNRKNNLKKLHSTQLSVRFSWLDAPTTIDMSEKWGKNSVQIFNDGVFLKHDEEGRVTHGVQPNKDRTSPIGWEKCNSDGNFYRKLPVWVDLDNLIDPKIIKKPYARIKTLDGDMDYKLDEIFVKVYQDNNGQPNLKDIWLIPLRELKSLYYVE